MAKTKVNVKADLPAINKRVQDTFKSFRRNKQTHMEAGEFVEKRVKAEARRGRPFNRSRSFPDLKSTTIDQREYLEQFNSTARTYSASRSNLTFTGQLIEAIVYELKQDQGLYSIEIQVADSERFSYRTGPNGTIKFLDLTNQELAEILDKKGFTLFDSDVIANNDNLRTRVTEIFRRTLRRAIANNNKKNNVNK